MAGDDKWLRVLVGSVESEDYDRIVYRRMIWVTVRGKRRPNFEYWVDNPYERPDEGQVKALGTVRELRRKLGMDT